MIPQASGSILAGNAKSPEPEDRNVEIVVACPQGSARRELPVENRSSVV